MSKHKKGWENKVNRCSKLLGTDGRCTSNAIYRGFCMQHAIVEGVLFLLYKRLIPTLSGITAIFTIFWVILPSLSSSRKTEENRIDTTGKFDRIERKEQCDMYSGGCVLDLTSTLVTPSGNLIAIGSGTYVNAPFLVEGQHFNFPPSRNDSIKAPYFFKIIGNKVYIKGELEDYYSTTPLGSFDWNDFEILPRKDNLGCAYSYNMDENGIEIINSNKEVCFALNLGDNWRFNGYFKDDYGNIHIYNLHSRV